MNLAKFTPLKWGILGAGKISHEFVKILTQLSRLEHQVVAVASRSEESSREFAKTYQIRNAYGNYKELVLDPDVDIVYIGTVNSCHFEQTKMSLEHGKHVLCEKALSVNAKEAKELARISRNENRFLMEGFWTRFFPAFKHLDQEIRDGQIGTVHNMILPIGAKFAQLERFSSRELAGGCLMNHAVYGVMVAVRILGKPDKILASGHLSETGVDLDVNFVLHYDNGASAVFIGSSLVPFSMALEIHGSKGTMKVPWPFWAPTVVESSVSRSQIFPLPANIKTGNGVNTPGFSYEIQEVADCLKKGLLESPLMPLEESILIYEICDEIRRQIGLVWPNEQEDN